MMPEMSDVTIPVEALHALHKVQAWIKIMPKLFASVFIHASEPWTQYSQAQCSSVGFNTTLGLYPVQYLGS